MFKTTLNEWNRLDKEITRIANNERVGVTLSMEFYPSKGKIELEKELQNLVSISRYKEGSYNIDKHEDHGMIIYQGALMGMISDFIKSIISEFSSSGNVILASFQSEIMIGEEIGGLIYGDSFKGISVTPAASGLRLNILELNF